MLNVVGYSGHQRDVLNTILHELFHWCGIKSRSKARFSCFNCFSCPLQSWIIFFAPSLADLFNGVVYSTHLLTRELLLLSAVSRQKGRLSFQEQSHTLMGLSCNTRHHLCILASSPAFKETVPWTWLQKGRGFSSLPKSGSSQGRA